MSVAKKRDVPKNAGVIKPVNKSNCLAEYHSNLSRHFRTHTHTYTNKYTVSVFPQPLFYRTSYKTVRFLHTVPTSELTMLHIKLTAKTAEKFENTL